VNDARSIVSAMVADGSRGTGAQLVAYVGDHVICDEGFGIARPGLRMTPETVQSLFCLTKPIAAAAAVAAADSHSISLDDDIRASSPRLRTRLGDTVITLRQVLSHAAGLRDIRAAEIMFLPGAAREAACDTVALDGTPGAMRVYSEFQGWNALRMWLEDVHGRPFGACVRELVLEPFAINDVYFGVSDDEWPAVHARLGVHYASDGGPSRPLLHELLRKHLDDPAMQAIGGYGTARGVARFYSRMLAFRDVMITPTAPPDTDPVLTSRVSFGLGFMTDLRDAFGAAMGARTFGHIGLLGTSFAFADPELGLVAVFASNGFLVEDADRVATRTALVDALYADAAAGA
jgi:CubicO group peptidase (beta-lactamase class C family)